MAYMLQCPSTRIWTTESIQEVVIITRLCSILTPRWRIEWRPVTVWQLYMTALGESWRLWSFIYWPLIVISDQFTTPLKKERTQMFQNPSPPNQTCSAERLWTWPRGQPPTSRTSCTAMSRTHGQSWRMEWTPTISTKGWDCLEIEDFILETSLVRVVRFKLSILSSLSRHAVNWNIFLLIKKLVMMIKVQISVQLLELLIKEYKNQI